MHMGLGVVCERWAKSCHSWSRQHFFVLEVFWLSLKNEISQIGMSSKCFRDKLISCSAHGFFDMKIKSKCVTEL